ncbi:MAG: hypothetical protein MJ117_08020, partial [Lachnospiraceae bacterium]|nr:hypothetical protein [Lachnospiraceae bacterium]
MDGKIIKMFLDAYGVDLYSTLGMEYQKYRKPYLQEALLEADAKNTPTEKDLKDKEEIEAALDADQLVRLMRRKMSVTNTALLRERLLRVQKVVNVPIMEKVYTSGQETFALNALYFLLHADVDYSVFLYKIYEEVRSEFMKSCLCLCMGIRGSKEMLPMLMQEAKRMSVNFPQEGLYQGPVIAVMELGARVFGT